MGTGGTAAQAQRAGDPGAGARKCVPGLAQADGDIDLLVEFEQGMEPGLIELAAMGSELPLLFSGRKVDLRTPRELSRHFRDQALRESVVQYVA